jgi:hypothetical protein
MKISRRELAGLVAAGGTALRAGRQTPGSAAESPAQLAQSVLEDVRKTAAEIRKFKVPTATEPAFAFKAQ